MLHDTIMRSAQVRADRRTGARVPLSKGEVVLLWHHDMETAIRYPLIDLADDGARILTATPLIKGMTGTAATLLPEGISLNRPCSVCWCRPRSEGSGYETGLQML